MTLDSTILVGLITFAGGTIGTCITMYINVTGRLRGLEIKVEAMEKTEEQRAKNEERRDARQDEKYDRILKKLDDHDEILTYIRIEMQNKQNR